MDASLRPLSRTHQSSELIVPLSYSSIVFLTRRLSFFFSNTGGNVVSTKTLLSKCNACNSAQAAAILFIFFWQQTSVGSHCTMITFYECMLRSVCRGKPEEVNRVLPRWLASKGDYHIWCDQHRPHSVPSPSPDVQISPTHLDSSHA